MFRMPSRVTPGHARDGDSPARSATPLSESERSFVSAESENTTSKRPCVDQSALSPSSSRRAQDAVSNTSSSPSSAFQQPTPLASRQASSSNTLKPTPSRSGPPAESYFSSQPSSGFESRSPGYKRPPASRSSHGIETRSGPPPALSTRRSYNADPSWRSSPPTIAELYQLSADGSIDWSLTDNAHEIDGGAKQAGSWPSAGMRSSQGGDLKGRTLAPTEDDPDPTLRVNGQKMRVSRGNGHQNQQQEDLFLNLARTDSVADDGSDTMSRVERRRVSALLFVLASVNSYGIRYRESVFADINAFSLDLAIQLPNHHDHHLQGAQTQVEHVSSDIMPLKHVSLRVAPSIARSQ